MEVFYDGITLEVKATYSHHYPGEYWQAQGYLFYERPGHLNSLIVPGAIIEFIDGDLNVAVPYVPPIIPRVDRYAEIGGLVTPEAKIDYLARYLFRKP